MVCDCGAEYHIKYNPPKKPGICDLCGGKLYRREDDDPKVVQRRLDYFHKRTKSILSYFEKLKKIIYIDGEREIKEVGGEIIKKLRKEKIKI